MLKKLIIIVLLLQSVMYAETFEWQSNKKVITIDDPLKNIMRMIEKDMSKMIYGKKPIDFTHEIPPEIPKPTLPPEIKKPSLPPVIKLVRDDFETSSAFKLRVQREAKKREAELKKLQEQYRKDVQKRNDKIEELALAYNKAVQKRNEKLKELQARHQEDLKRLKLYYKAQEKAAAKKLTEFAAHAVSRIYGKPRLLYKGYDADHETMRLLVTSSDGKNFQKDITMKIPIAEAKDLKEHLSKYTPKVLFDVSMVDKGSINFSIKEISIRHKNKTYVANDTTSFATAAPVYVTIQNATQDFDAPSADFSLQKADANLGLQNPNLTDAFTLGAVAYAANGSIVGSNELVNLIRTLPARKINKHHWLFMIAVENYEETDHVQYAQRSAVAMKDILQKRLGIDNKHTYALIESKATSGAIKDKLQALIARVREGDTIYFYYSGHGIPSKKGDAFILPRDKVVDFIDKDPFFKLENIYAMLSDSRAKHSFVFIDACFSGKTDNKLLFKGVAPGLIRTKRVPYDKKKMTIITAGKNNEFSNMYEEKRYRLFSYYLTKALIDDIRDVSLLYKKVNVDVLQKSKELGSRYEQNPQIYGDKKAKLY